MPLDTSNSGQYLTSRWSESFRPGLDPAVRKRLELGFKQLLARDPFDLALAFPTLIGRSQRRVPLLAGLPSVVPPPPSETSSYDTYTTTPASTTTPPPPTSSTPTSTSPGGTGTHGTTSSLSTTLPTTGLTTESSNATTSTTVPPSSTPPETTTTVRPPWTTDQPSSSPSSSSASGSGSDSRSGSDVGSGSDPGSGSDSGSGSNSNCVVKGTPILMADGSTKPVELLKAGDRIASVDIAGMKRDVPYRAWCEWRSNKEGILTPCNALVEDIVWGRHKDHFLINGRIGATFEHPFLVRRGEWFGFVSSSLIEKGDLLCHPSGEMEEVVDIDVIEGLVETYKLHIPGTNTFVAGDIYIHNDADIPITSENPSTDSTDYLPPPSFTTDEEDSGKAAQGGL